VFLDITFQSLVVSAAQLLYPTASNARIQPFATIANQATSLTPTPAAIKSKSQVPQHQIQSPKSQLKPTTSAPTSSNTSWKLNKDIPTINSTTSHGAHQPPSLYTIQPLITSLLWPFSELNGEEMEIPSFFIQITQSIFLSRHLKCQWCDYCCQAVTSDCRIRLTFNYLKIHSLKFSRIWSLLMI